MILPSLVLLLFVTLSDEPLRLTDNAVVSFAPASLGAEILSRRDPYIAGMSVFDRQSRVGRAGPVTEQEVRALVRSSVREWSPEEKKRLTARLRRLAPLLARFRLPFPPEIVLIKTSGREEGGALYTRMNAVIFAEGVLRRSDDDKLDRLILHELFHVLSRHNPALTDELYNAIGFKECGTLLPPPGLAGRLISNPDIAETAYAIRVRHRGRQIDVTPILYSQVPYNSKKGGTFFSYMKLGLLEVQRSGDLCLPVAKSKPELLQPKSVRGFFEQVGRNTDYVSDPQEILADNFVLLVLGSRKIPSPEIPARMAEILAPAAAEVPHSQADRR